MKKFFGKLFSHISSLFKNGSPYWSSTRFAFILSVVISNVSIFGLWIFLSIMNNMLLPIDSSIIVIYAICNGLLSAAKLIQKPMENHSSHKE
jgi:hypothetical protein